MPGKAANALAFWVIALSAVGVGGYAVIAYTLFPFGSTVHPEMAATYAEHRPAIVAHIFGSALTLLLGPAQFHPKIRKQNPKLHRLLGRVYLLCGVGIGGIGGLYMSFFAFGGLVSASGFASLAILWLFTGYHAFATARQKKFAEHRKWMVRNFALALAAVTLRVQLGLGFATGIPFEIFYPAIAWLSWLPNVVVGEWRLHRGTR